MRTKHACTGATLRARLFPSSRITVTAMMFFGCLISFILRVNIGFAMVCMIKSHHIHANSTHISRLEIRNFTFSNESFEKETEHEDGCQGIYKETSTRNGQIGEFDWDKTLQGAILGGIFYGNLMTQITAGWLSDRYGGKSVLGIGLGTLSALTLTIPELARFNPYVMLGVRIVQGMFAAVTFPAIHSIISKWAPPTEMGVLMTIAYSGLNVGTLVLFPLSGLLCEYGFAGGWPSIFYVTGVFGLIYVIGLKFLVFDDYERHPRISLKEKRYLQETIIGHHQARKHIKTPWLEIIKCGPMWAIVIAHVSGNWGFYTLVLTLPLFMKEVLQFDIEQNALLSSLPNLCAFIVKLAFASVADHIRQCSCMSLTAQRKLFTGIGMFLPALCMLCIPFLDCQRRYLAVGVFAACNGLMGIATSGGYFYNHVDLSPQHAGTLMGISTTFATIPGILVPLIVGLLTPHGGREEWAITFYIATGVYIIGGAAYLLLASGERQKWSFAENKPQPQLEGHDNPIFLLTDSNVSIVSYKQLPT